MGVGTAAPKCSQTESTWPCAVTLTYLFAAFISTPGMLCDVCCTFCRLLWKRRGEWQPDHQRADLQPRWGGLEPHAATGGACSPGQSMWPPLRAEGLEVVPLSVSL